MEIVVARRAAGNIRAELARRGLRQQELAAQLGRSQAWLSRRLTGGVAMTLDELEAIAQALAIPVDRLLQVAA